MYVGIYHLLLKTEQIFFGESEQPEYRSKRELLEHGLCFKSVCGEVATVA